MFAALRTVCDCVTVCHFATGRIYAAKRAIRLRTTSPPESALVATVRFTRPAQPRSHTHAPNPIPSLLSDNANK